MQFCPRCGSILSLVPLDVGERSTCIVKCKNCGYTSVEEDGKLELRKFAHSPKQMVAVVKKDEEISTDQAIPFDCPRCGNKLAFVWQVQTRSADEASTQFLRCTNCGYTTREYS